MKVVQLLEAQAGESRAHAGQHFLEVVAIHFHRLPTRGRASAEIAGQQNAERSLGLEHRGRSTRIGIDIQMHFTEVGFDSHVSQPLSITTHRPEWGSRRRVLNGFGGTRSGEAFPVGQTLGQTASFRQTAPETWCQSRVCGVSRSASPKTVKHRPEWGSRSECSDRHPDPPESPPPTPATVATPTPPPRVPPSSAPVPETPGSVRIPRRRAIRRRPPIPRRRWRRRAPRTVRRSAPRWQPTPAAGRESPPGRPSAPGAAASWRTGSCGSGQDARRAAAGDASPAPGAPPHLWPQPSSSPPTPGARRPASASAVPARWWPPSFPEKRDPSTGGSDRPAPRAPTRSEYASATAAHRASPGRQVSAWSKSDTWLRLSHPLSQARSTGPALGGWAIQQLWLFWLAPIAGGALAGIVYPLIAGSDEPVYEVFKKASNKAA